MPETSNAFRDFLRCGFTLNDTAYNDFPNVKAALLDLGIRHVRDGLVDSTWQPYYDRLNELGRAGVHAQLICGMPSQHNEKYHPPHDRIGPSICFSNQAQLGDLSEFLDYGNSHPYPGGGPLPESVHHTLLRKADGWYSLLVWNDVRSWDPGKHVAAAAEKVDGAGRVEGDRAKRAGRGVDRSVDASQVAGSGSPGLRRGDSHRILELPLRKPGLPLPATCPRR